ncbi:DDE-type integrase/transposase/recombinase [Granulicella tundricola]|uniref:Integrase catalytic region n=1 Tax=Granulicella tundricola (strain ATCC BAA-1859 / DSM 23138 / MP5ACTX9) TaxID=1198114 RepID=E8X2D4_GRATM|nr:DDE-type integrase/transposase/recombinase [Granulicella tundricola]ADW68066.1 Integrase catalytic region [Granulicella tundricola MP5ACTX9]
MTNGRGLRLSSGEEVYFEGRRCEIVAVLDLETAIVELRGDGGRIAVPVASLRSRPSTDGESHIKADLNQVSAEVWAIAETRLDAIRPLLDLPKRTKALVCSRAKELGISYGPLYVWIHRYESTMLLSSLLPLDRSGGRGRTRITPERESLLLETIQSHYLNKQKLTTQNVHRELKNRCFEAGLRPPSVQTVRNRIGRIDAALITKRRQGARAQRSFEPTIGSFPEVAGPYGVIQIDHTMLDVQLVDEQHRKSIGRAYITIAIDVFSRMVAGFYVSLDPTGDLSTGLCLVHAILPKKPWLERLGLDVSWSCHGLMDTIHTDNAKEFRGKTLARAAAEYGITLKRRPVRQPHYGGHIERLIGTTLKQLVHTLPGSTFSNVAEKGEYDSEGNACLTIAETERILTLWFTGSYHQTIHRGILMTPLEKYRLGRLGTEPGGKSAPRLPEDMDRLRIDFMPSIERCILSYGVVIDEVYYWGDILRPWINAPDPHDRKKKRLFLFKRDPRDVSVIQFLDPTTNTFHPISYRNITHPSMSLWELREARKRLKIHGKKTIDEHAIFQAHRSIQAEVKSAAEKTRSARRESARKAVQGNRESLPSPAADLVLAELQSKEFQYDEIPEFEVRER